MAQTTKPILMRIDNNGSMINDSIVVKQFDTKSRFLGIILLNENGQPYNLTGCEVIFSVKKPDGHDIFNIVTINNAIKGSIIVELTTQALAAFGIANAELTIYGANRESILTSATFTIDIKETIRSEDAVESTDEFTALTDLMNRYWDFHARVVSIDDKMGIPQETDDTFFNLLYRTNDSVMSNQQGIEENSSILSALVGRYPFENKNIITSNTTWIVPNDVYRVRISAIASGGNGGNGAYGTRAGGGGGGACGDWIINTIYSVLPGEQIPIVVGLGNTTIKGIVLLKGGNGEIGKGTSSVSYTDIPILGGNGGKNSSGNGGFGGLFASGDYENPSIGGNGDTSGSGGGGGCKGCRGGNGGNDGGQGGLFGGSESSYEQQGGGGGGGGSAPSFFQLDSRIMLAQNGGNTTDASQVTRSLGGQGGLGYGAGGGGGASGRLLSAGIGGNGAPGCVIIEW